VSVWELTTQSFVENGLHSFTLHKSSNICNERTGPISWKNCFLYFLRNSFCRHLENNTKSNWNSNLRGLRYGYLKFTHLIRQNYDIIFSCFSTTKNYLLIKNRRQSINVLNLLILWKTTSLAFCWHSLQTNSFFFGISIHERWRLSALCTKPKVEIPVLKVVSNLNFQVQNIRGSNSKFNILFCAFDP